MKYHANHVTKRTLGKREDYLLQGKKKYEKETAGRHTGTQKAKAEQEDLKSAVTDHCRSNNHIIDWDKGKTITMESNKSKPWIQETIEIRKRASGTINRATMGHTPSCTPGIRSCRDHLPAGCVVSRTGSDRSVRLIS